MTTMPTPKRLPLRTLMANFVTFPIRAAVVLQRDRYGVTSLRTERLHYAAQEVRGTVLDIGCGPHNTFVKEWLHGHGLGVDVYEYEGLEPSQIVDMEALPYDEATFDSVSMIAVLNHIPRSQRAAQLGEVFRVLKPGGNVVVTQPNPIAGYLVHKLVHTYSHRFGTHTSMDHDRGMHEEEDLYLRDRVVRDLLTTAGFADLQKRRFWSQWGFNHLYNGWKR